ncbi:MAG: aminotransferase class I/II-fold pyridoxal phosphate-dependent enzyme [Oscillospiraceae bacterium]
MKFSQMTKEQLAACYAEEQSRFAAFKAQDLKLDMSRGKPAPEQLDTAAGLLDALKSGDMLAAADGTDARNYGGLDGIPEAKALFAEMMGVAPDEIFVGGNSSLNLMYDAVAKALIFGVDAASKPWGKYEKIKWLCIVPGYDRHFAICESFGIEMVNVPFKGTDPDMDAIEALVAADEAIKGIWCVPKYSNPTGTTYSDDAVRRFAALKPKAADFRIFWDNAYCVHDLTETPDSLLNIFDECKKLGTEDMVYAFGSTSKITFAGAGVAVMASSKKNLAFLKALATIQTIGYDKVNQLRHVRYFGNYAGLLAQMEKHKSLIAPKFDAVLEILEQEIAPLGIGTWHKPNGGYFISLDTPAGCAKRVAALCKEAGVILTPAGATYPYGIDPADANLRIAPTYPSPAELTLATQILCSALKIAALEKLM